MKKSAKILKSYELVKFANYPYGYVPEEGTDLTYMTPNTMGQNLTSGAINSGIIAPAAYKGYQQASAMTPGIRPTFRNIYRQTAINYGGITPASATPAATRLGGALRTGARFLGPAATAASVALAGYGVYDAGRKMNTEFQQSGFAGKPGGQAAYTFGTTAGRNRLLDTVQGGSLTLAGAAIGAGIGSFAGGIGALPGAAVGALAGGAAELGLGAARKATGWDGAKYDAARKFYKGNVSEDQAVGTVLDAVQNPNKKMFESKGFLSGKRDLGSEAQKDVAKEEEFVKMRETQQSLKNKNNAFQQNIG